MQSKKIIVEMGVALTVLIVLVVLAVPKFLDAQTRHSEQRIQYDLTAFVQEIDLTQPIKKLSELKQPFLDGGLNHMYHKAGLDENGLREQPYTLVYGFTNTQKLIQSIHQNFSNKNLELKNLSQSNSNGTILLFYSIRGEAYRNMGLAVPWHSTHEIDRHRYQLSKKLFYIQDNNDSHVLKSDYYYDSSNGLNSFGYVYHDSIGNRSSPAR